MEHFKIVFLEKSLPFYLSMGNNMLNRLQFLGIGAMAWSLISCQTKHEIEVKPIEVKPMEVTLNINLNIKMVNEELDELFGES
jgi:hypothetical protein